MNTAEEMEASRRQAERRARALFGNGAASGTPFSSAERIDTGIATAVTPERPQPDAEESQSNAVRKANIPPSDQPEPNNQPNQSATKFDHTAVLDFYYVVRPSAFVLGFTQGRSITSAEQFQALAKEADNKHEHLFFNVATLKREWTDPTTHEKGKVTTASKDNAVNMPDGSTSHVFQCTYLWGDCDAVKYKGNDPQEAKIHYESEGRRISDQVDDGLNRLGITPFAKWRSGAGWQFLIKLDQAIEPNEAETLVGKLHIALGFDPVVRNCNRILRVPGSVNWKDGKDGRVPAPCLPLCLLGAITKVHEVREALANVAEPQKPMQSSGVPGIKIDWSKVRRAAGWLQSVDDLPADTRPKLRVIVGHSGTLDELNRQLIGTKLLAKPYSSWSEVTLALAAGLNASGLYSPEQIAEALSADLPCNQHIAKQKDKERAIERAVSRSHSLTQVSVSVAGVKFRDFHKDGKTVRPSLANAVIAIRALGINVRYDLFHHRTEIAYKGQARTIREGLLTDDTVSAVRSLINNTYEIDCGDPNTLAAIKEIALEHAYDPVLDLLDECQGKWDGVNRLDTWVIDYLGCEDTRLNHAIGRKVLIAACRRARVPGCKFDTITVLEGVEGTNKSTAIRVLAGDDNFSDQSILGATDKDVQEQLDGVWMHENADLAGMRRAEVEQIKAFASRQADRARRAYGRVREDQRRRSIEWGTTNNKEYLLSQTGNRRFWPLETGKIDIEALRRDREQLLGEAATREAAGESITLDQSLWADARDAQEERRVKDPWEDILATMPKTVCIYEKDTHMMVTLTIIHSSGDGFERVASAELLDHVLNIPRAQQTSAHAQRLAHAMEHVGWKRHQSGRVTINGKPQRGYVRPAYGPTGPSGPTGPQGVASLNGVTGPTGSKGGAASYPPDIVSAAAQAQADLALVQSRMKDT